jgi:hypothetical protein
MDSNHKTMYVSGQHNPMSWNSLMVGIYLIAEKLGKDSIDITTLDMLRVDLDLLETLAGNARYGGSGISHSLTNTHLVMTAIHNAIGEWVDPPATPDRL